MRGIVLVLALGLLFAGCGADDGPTDPEEEAPEFAGWWKGGLSGDRILILASETEDAAISGAAAVGERGVWGIEGSHDHPALTFTATGETSGLGDWSFAGAFTDDDTVQGSISGDDFAGTLVLTRDEERND